MKHTICSVLLFSAAFTCFGAIAHSQEQTPQLLIRATHCLVAKEFLPSPKPRTLTLGYFLDEKSYSPETVIYVVTYAAPARSNGLVFALFLKERNSVQTLDIQNNASFVLSKKDVSGVAFVDPPLGGTWTQEHLASAIKQIEKQPRFTVALTDVSGADPSIRCEAYTDAQPKK